MQNNSEKIFEMLQESAIREKMLKEDDTLFDSKTLTVLIEADKVTITEGNEDWEYKAQNGEITKEELVRAFTQYVNQKMK